jgi:hypothetical protein
MLIKKAQTWNPVHSHSDKLPNPIQTREGLGRIFLCKPYISIPEKKKIVVFLLFNIWTGLCKPQLNSSVDT